MTTAAAPGDALGISRTTIKLVFLTQAIASGSFFTRVPDLQQGLGMDAATLGLTFLGQPIGAIAMFLFASRIIERAGTRRVLLWGLPGITVAMVLMALASAPLLLAGSIALYAALFALTNVAMNVEADRVEATTGKRVMNMCHGLWSIGQLSVFTLGVFARGWNISPTIHFGAIVPLVLIATLLVVLPMRVAPPRDHTADSSRRKLALPSSATLRLLVFMLGGAMVEAAARTWSVIYARDSFTAPDWADSLTLPVFVAAIAVGRFFADGWSHRYGPAMLARTLLCFAFAGLAIIVFASNLPLALVGFAFAGFGICTSFPAATSAAAQLGDRPSSENVAALTMSVQTVMLGVPPLMGFVAESFGIRGTYAMVLPLVALAILLARALEPRRTT